VSIPDESPQHMFVRALKIEPEWAVVLVANGLTTLEEIAYVPIDELRALDGVDEQKVQAWRAQARRHLQVQAIPDDDKEDPMAVATHKPPKPTADGSGATIDDEDR
jgi:transcription termination factor NusA